MPRDRSTGRCFPRRFSRTAPSPPLLASGEARDSIRTLALRVDSPCHLSQDPPPLPLTRFRMAAVFCARRRRPWRVLVDCFVVRRRAGSVVGSSCFHSALFVGLLSRPRLPRASALSF